MVTEAFILSYNDKKTYLDIDRTYKYGGLMLLSDDLDKTEGGLVGATYFEEFSVEKWLDALNLTDATLTLEVHKNCDGMINKSINKNKFDDILLIEIKNKEIIEVKNSNNEIIYTKGDCYVQGFPVGWFGMIFDYYTNIISTSILEYDSAYDDYIWGVSY